MTETTRVAAGTSIPAHIEHRIATPDGRTLAVAEWGDPEGLAVIACHGGPGSRIAYWPPEPAIFARFGLRRLTFDRPGYGESTRRRGRTVGDGAADVAAIADALGIERFAVSGRSYGGPHAMACAALLPERVLRCLAVVPVAPFDAEGLDFLAGMNEGNRREFGAAVAGEAPLRVLLESERLAMIERLAAGRADFLGDDYAMADADRAQMTKDQQQVADQMLTGLAPGPDGLVDDDLAFVKPWGFDPASIAVPVALAYGRQDTLIPAAHGDWLAAHIPGATVWVDETTGHLPSEAHMARDLAWLAGSG